jgi:putative heme-binding domain-containing protein
MSSDPWFHAIALSHAPDGSIFITDFYREIIEDYSAIPRYLQQEYGLIHGKDHGRIWRLTHADSPPGPAADMSRLTAEQLAGEVGSLHFWRRNTARRLLVERQLKVVAPILSRLARESAAPVAVLNALHTLNGLGALRPEDVESALSHADPSVRRQALRFSERWLKSDPGMIDQVLGLATDKEPMVRLQLALSLGESGDARAMPVLVQLARVHGDEPWMALAILTSLPGRGGALLTDLLRSPAELAKAEGLLEPLSKAIAHRRDGSELSRALVEVAGLENRRLQATCLRGLRSGFQGPTAVALSEPARASVRTLSLGADAAVRSQALPLIELLGLETTTERRARLAQAGREVSDARLSVEARLAAVSQLADDDDPIVADMLLAAFPSSTPQVRESILGAILSRRDRLPALLDALATQKIPPSLLSAVQRATLLDAREPEIRRRAATLLKSATEAKEELFEPYVKALQDRRDSAHGQQVFREKCSSCHQAHGLGYAVGPDLSAEFQRAEETVIRDVLAPSNTISPGYVTFSVATTDGRVFSGLLVAESPTSLTVRQAEGKEQAILRKDVDQVRAMSVSLMPEDLPKTVTPRDLADLLAWLRRPPTDLILMDENQELIEALNQGTGTAEFIAADRYTGGVSLRVTPPQRFAPRIKGWEFRIREHPGPGEYRYIRFAWKSGDAHGQMLELAADGRWPPAEMPLRRYHAGRNTTGWQSVEISPDPPREWTVVTRDLWKDFGDFTLTGIAPTAMGGAALFDRIELLQTGATATSQ